ncbi:hypothetical protein [Halosimplex halobium]|uniref:hypothetical protein n=1 Tax=Halosimplex halobium TaxID=3396618 RepID=UPI003F55265F
MSVEIRGFEELADELDRLQDRTEAVDGETAVSFAELFPEDFMQTHTEFESIRQFFEASPWTVESEADFDRIPGEQFDAYVDEHTGFNSWEAMLSAAAREWIGRELAA